MSSRRKKPYQPPPRPTREVWAKSLLEYEYLWVYPGGEMAAEKIRERLIRDGYSRVKEVCTEAYPDFVIDIHLTP